jgi:hypothetical protein
MLDLIRDSLRLRKVGQLRPNDGGYIEIGVYWHDHNEVAAIARS